MSLVKSGVKNVKSALTLPLTFLNYRDLQELDRFVNYMAWDGKW